jgi:hypothetical protein
MPPHICYFCHNSFTQKGHLGNHFNNTTKCKFKKYDDLNNIKTYISHVDMVLMFESDEYHNLFFDITITPKSLQNHSKSLQNHSKITPNHSKSLQNHSKNIINRLECEYCHKIFTRIDNKNKHIKKNRCQILKNNLQITNNNHEIINNNHQIINNQQIINNNKNKITNNNVNIQINGYGKEDVSYITNDILADIIKKPISGIPKLIEMIHLNPDHPENNNIKLVNKNLPYLNYFNGKYWKTADKSKVLGNLLKSKTELTDKYYKNLDIEDTLGSYEKYSDAIKYVMNNFGFKDPSLKNKPSKKKLVEIYKKAEKDLFSMILNYREYVKELCNS